MNESDIKNEDRSPLRLVLSIAAICAVIFSSCSLYAGRPGASMNVPVDTANLRQTVHVLTNVNPPRNAHNVPSLDESAQYILREFEKTECRTEIQSFAVKGQEYKNVVCSFGPEGGERIVIGAHYDVYGEQPGADDNASGVAGLLELARLIHVLKPDLKYRLDFAAYTLEEPQFFRTRHMGSHIHAESLAKGGVGVRAMIALEMIGYFSDSPKSQRYPLFFLKWFYPDRGNYIAVVGKWGQGDLVARVQHSMKGGSRVPVESITAPALVPGIDFSDHQSFWRWGYKAVMVTDTAFFRNRNYHKPTDTIDTLDFERMTEVVKGLYRAILDLQ